MTPPHIQEIHPRKAVKGGNHILFEDIHLTPSCLHKTITSSDVVPQADVLAWLPAYFLLLSLLQHGSCLDASLQVWVRLHHGARPLRFSTQARVTILQQHILSGHNCGSLDGRLGWALVCGARPLLFPC